MLVCKLRSASKQSGSNMCGCPPVDNCFSPAGSRAQMGRRKRRRRLEARRSVLGVWRAAARMPLWDCWPRSSVQTDCVRASRWRASRNSNERPCCFWATLVHVCASIDLGAKWAAGRHWRPRVEPHWTKWGPMLTVRRVHSAWAHSAQSLERPHNARQRGGRALVQMGRPQTVCECEWASAFGCISIECVHCQRLCAFP